MDIKKVHDDIWLVSFRENDLGLCLRCELLPLCPGRTGISWWT